MLNINIKYVYITFHQNTYFNHQRTGFLYEKTYTLHYSLNIMKKTIVNEERTNNDSGGLS